MGSARRDASIENLIESLQDLDPIVRIHAAFSLQAMGEDASPAVPVLIEMLRHGDVQDRKVALTTLSEIGPAAYEAVPALLEAANEDDHQGVSDLAIWALEQIDLVEPDEEDAEAA